MEPSSQMLSRVGAPLIQDAEIADVIDIADGTEFADVIPSGGTSNSGC